MTDSFPVRHRSATGPVVGTHYIRLDERTDSDIRQIQAETNRVFIAMGYGEFNASKVATMSMLIKKGIEAHKKDPNRLA